MSTIFFLALVLIVGAVASLFGLFMAWQGSRAIWQIVSRPSVSVHRLREGQVEVAGVTECDTPLENDGKKLVAVDARVTCSVSKHRTSIEFVRVFAPGLSVRDATGSCRLLTEHARLATGQRSWDLPLDELTARFPLYAQAAQVAARTCGLVDGRTPLGTMVSLSIAEQTIELGEQVLVTAHAVVDADAAPQGYRRGSEAMALTGREDAWMLLSAGSEPVSLLRVSLPVVSLVLVSSALLGMVGWMGWVCLRLWM